MAKKQEPGNLPEAKYGRGTLTVAIFENEVEKEGKKLKLRKIQIQKSFKNPEGEWENRQISLNPSELLKAAMYLQMCAQYIEQNPIAQEQAEETMEEIIEE